MTPEQQAAELRDLADRIESRALFVSRRDVICEMEQVPGTKLFVPTGEQTLELSLVPGVQHV